MKDAVDALGRAEAAEGPMKTASGNNWPGIAAIGMRETYFQDIHQYGDGLGREYFQIDIGQNPQVSEEQAYNINFAAQWAWNKVTADIRRYTNNPINLNPWDLLPEAIHDYNASPFTHGGTMNQALGGVPGLDQHTTGHNYVSNVLNLINCFRLGSSMNLPPLPTPK